MVTEARRGSAAADRGVMWTGHGLITAVYFLHTWALCCCQRGSNDKPRDNSKEIRPELVAGIVVIVALLAGILSICFFCKRCRGKKQRQIQARKRKYAINNSRPNSAISFARPSSAVSTISSLDQQRPRMAHPVNDIEVIDEDLKSDIIEEHPPSPFAPM